MSAETNAIGHYMETIKPESITNEANNSTLPVTATFDGAGTNLGASQARTTVTVPTESGAIDGISNLSDSTIATLAVEGHVTFVFGILCIARRRGENTDEEPASRLGPDDGTEQTDEPDPMNPSERWLGEA